MRGTKLKLGPVTQQIECHASNVKVASAILVGTTMKKMRMSAVDDLDEINDRMIGWNIDKVEGGMNGENLFIFHLSKGSSQRTVCLSANALGGWLSERSR